MNVSRSEDKEFDARCNLYASASVLRSRENSQPFVAVGLLFATLLPGTGGLYSPANAALVSEWTNVPAITISSVSSIERKKPTQQVSIPTTILKIRDRLGLKMSEVADIFGVSRQAVYLWLKGDNLKTEYVLRVWQLSRIAERLQLAGIDRPEHFIHRPLSPEGSSLFHLLVSGANVDSALTLLKEQFDAEQSSREKSLAEHQHARGRNHDPSSVMELATPILEEVDG
jgi:transcriptional regulator with XRE-family HTH domain